jgi:LytR cell envelope-related transcriptional attenuator
VGAKHEPSSPSSFFVSLATATLRGILVVAAVILGVFVLSRAFPTGETATVPQGPTVAPETEEPQTPVGTGSPTTQPTEADECPDARDVPPVQVLNGTDVTGLAASAAERLTSLGYKVPDAAISNAATSDYETTVVQSTGPQQVAAGCLAQEEFRGADLERAEADADYDITVILGQDYADRR